MRFLLLFFAALSALQIEAQTLRMLHVGARPFKPSANIEESWHQLKLNPNAQLGGDQVAIVQFDYVPTEDQKDTWRANGVTVISYIPDFAWVALINASVSPAELSELGAVAIEAIRPEWKLAMPLASWHHSSSYAVRILYWGQAMPTTVQELTGAQVLALADDPSVQYIDLYEGEPQEETILQQAHRAISTYISNNPAKGYYYTGAGVKIGVHESNLVDPLQNPNFGNRLNRTFETGSGANGHKTGVAMRMASAGNLNPIDRGTAFGATIYSGGFNIPNAAASGLTIINHSVGWGCSTSSTTYGTTSYNYDYWVTLFPTWTMTYSAGNIGSSTCYANTANYGTITGVPKMAKNIFVVGATGHDGSLTGFSSCGPAKDGRILPTVVAPGDGGTSHASPNLGGVYAQLNQAYRLHNNNQTPHSGLLKAVIMNTADDMENPGPDFRTGFGSINGRRALEVIKNGQVLSSSVTQGNQNTHNITVPANVKQLKVMVYWTDYPATVGITTRTLVNNLDATLQTPTQVNYLPWVLNPAFDPVTLDDPAIRAVDSLNNSEQMTLDNPAAGTYKVFVSGTAVPQGPQSYFLTYEFLYDEIVVTHPHGGEKLLPGDVERIRWDALPSSSTFDLEYSTNGGSSWQSMANGVSASDRHYDWTIPAVTTDQALVRVKRGTLTGTSDTTFTIYERPIGLSHVWTCADSSLFTWTPQSGADAYVLFKLGTQTMDSIAYSSDHTEVLHGLSLSESEFVAVSAVKNGVISQRSIALERLPGTVNCVPQDAGLTSIIRPYGGFLPSCMANAIGPLTVELRNWGVNGISNVPVAYRLNGGSIIRDTLAVSIPSGQSAQVTFNAALILTNGQNQIEVWAELSGDANSSNDTLLQTVQVYNGSSASVNQAQSFDAFSGCSTAWGCEGVSCALQQGWYNIPNTQGDDIDWRTNSGGTGSGGTGPSADHTTGSGNYLYLEGSGNGGAGCTNEEALLYSPCFDLSDIGIAELSFWYHAYGSGIGNLYIDVLAEGVLYSDVAHPVSGAQGNQWSQAVVDLSAFGNQQIVVVFRGSTGGNYVSDLAIDDIRLDVGPIARFDSLSLPRYCAGDTIQLTNTSQYAQGYQWSIGTGNSFVAGSNAQSSNISFVLGNAPTVQVMLIASNALGSDTAQSSIFDVWQSAPSIVIDNEYCEDDDVWVQTNNEGLWFQLMLSGNVTYSGSDTSVALTGAMDGDSIWALYEVHSSCTLQSNTVSIDRISIDTSLVLSTNDISAVDLTSGTSYQWVDCANNYAAIAGETNATFTPSSDGLYAVVLERGACVDTSACVDFVMHVSGVDDLFEPHVEVYPNPSSGEVFVKIHGRVNGEVLVYGLDGRLFAQNRVTNKIEQVNLPVSSGVYLIEVRVQDRVIQKRIVRL